jgi:hypothetical protein
LRFLGVPQHNPGVKSKQSERTKSKAPVATGVEAVTGMDGKAREGWLTSLRFLIQQMVTNQEHHPLERDGDGGQGEPRA